MDLSSYKKERNKYAFAVLVQMFLYLSVLEFSCFFLTILGSSSDALSTGKVPIKLTPSRKTNKIMTKLQRFPFVYCLIFRSTFLSHSFVSIREWMDAIEGTIDFNWHGVIYWIESVTPGNRISHTLWILNDSQHKKTLLDFWVTNRPFYWRRGSFFISCALRFFSFQMIA